MKVLVTGATGFIGKVVLSQLAAAGHVLTVLTRDVDTAPVRLPVNARVFAWDPSLLQPPLEAFAGIQAVVHLAGENIAGRWTQDRKAEIKRSRLLSTHHLVETFKRLETPPEVFICASGTGFYGDRQAVELDDNASRGDGFLSAVCQAWEAEAQNAEALGVRTVPLRIGIVLGKEGGALRFMLPAFRLCLGGPLSDGEQWMSWIHVRDLAKLILHVLDRPEVTGPVNAVAPHPVSNRTFAKTLGRVLARPAVIPVPKILLKVLLRDAADLVLGSLRVVPQKALAAGFAFDFPELEPALESICYEVGHEFRMEQWLPHPRERVFDFFSNADNLEKIAPPAMSFKIVHMSTPDIKAGTRIDYHMQLHGAPVRWQSFITDWRRPEGFADFQMMGPYWVWHHTHEFVDKEGGTLIQDRAVYRLPFWVFGEVLGHPWVRRNLESIFLHRRRRVAELLGE